MTTIARTVAAAPIATTKTTLDKPAVHRTLEVRTEPTTPGQDFSKAQADKARAIPLDRSDRTKPAKRDQLATLELPAPKAPRGATLAATTGARTLDTRTPLIAGATKEPSTQAYFSQLDPFDAGRTRGSLLTDPFGKAGNAADAQETEGGGADGAPQAPTPPTGFTEIADDIAKQNGDAAEALLKSMPDLDAKGADELAKLLKVASVAKGVSVATMVLDIGNVAMMWKEHGLDDKRTQDAMAGLVGGAAGSAIGAALGGPIGAALGGMIGSWAGPKVADFVRDLADRYGDDVKKAVGTIVDGVEAVGSSIADAADAVAGAAKDLFNGVFGDDGFIDDITPDWPF